MFMDLIMGNALHSINSLKRLVNDEDQNKTNRNRDLLISMRNTLNDTITVIDKYKINNSHGRKQNVKI